MFFLSNMELINQLIDLMALIMFNDVITVLEIITIDGNGLLLGTMSVIVAWIGLRA